jgi:hypothetical protein
MRGANIWGEVMGEDVSGTVFTNQDRARYRRKVRRCLDVFALMLHDLRFDGERPMTGLELELSLIDAEAAPAMRNAQLIEVLADSAFQTELGRFNLEINARPRLLAGEGFDEYERDLLASLARADAHAAEVDASLVTIGTLPTLAQRHAVIDSISPEPRYQLLNEQMVGARGEDFALNIHGVERLQARIDSIAAEAASTSLQFHLQVAPADFAAYWNASQAIAGAQVALGANAPYLFGRRLWAETRIVLFEQATDTRPDELKAQGVRPRVWFGERWITSIFDLFEENVRYFPSLLPITTDEDPAEVLRSGGVPALAELRLHNGTVYRWNRPIYDITGGQPHVRVENRVLPAGPTVVDMLANAAFYFGVSRELAESGRPIWTQLTFSQAEQNFHASARSGLDAQVYWPRLGELPVTRLVREHLLPAAYTGLDRFGVLPRVRDRLLDVIEQRCLTGRNGAAWQTSTVEHLEERRNLTRAQALVEMLRQYARHASTNEPVHTWPVS